MAIGWRPFFQVKPGWLPWRSKSGDESLTVQKLDLQRYLLALSLFKRKINIGRDCI